MSKASKNLKDPNLSEAEQEAIIGTFVRRHENERLRERWTRVLSTEYRVTRPTTKVPGRTIRKILLPIIASAACLLLVVSLPASLQEPGDQLVAVYLAGATIENSRSAPETDLEEARAQMVGHYSSGRFEAAVSAGEALVLMPGATLEDRFHLGLAYLKHSQLSKAITSFSVVTHQPSDYRAEAYFYLGLSLLNQGKTTAGLEALERIKETDGQKLYEKAQNLLQAPWGQE